MTQPATGDVYDFWDFSLAYQAAVQHKFAHLNKIDGVNLPGLSYAYHFDAGLYAQFLRQFSENLGVRRVEGKVSQVLRHADSGDIASLVLQDGQQIHGDLFLDCSGLHALLIEKTLNTGFEDWSHWLPADSALAVPCAAVDPSRLIPNPLPMPKAGNGAFRCNIASAMVLSIPQNTAPMKKPKRRYAGQSGW